MRIIVKRCEVWRGFWWEALNCESQKKAAGVSFGVPSEPGVVAKCPFCGWKFFAEDRVVPRVFRCVCGELRLKAKRAVRKARRLHRPSRKVELYCLDCGWEETWGRAECVRRIQEDYGCLLCPDCHYDLGITYMEGVPPYVTNPWFR
jgi:hypothetical protein